LSSQLVILEVPQEGHDAVLLDTVARWAAEGPVSFLRANKPNWRLEVTRHAEGTLEPSEADAVADTALVLELLARERAGKPVAARREIVLIAMSTVARRLGLRPVDVLAWHRSGYAWALRLGRWDDAGIAALEARFAMLRSGIDDLLRAPLDPRVEARWARVSRPAERAESLIAAAQSLLSSHANRLGVFAEAEAILHFLMFRRAGGTHAEILP
jgi:hypothetical protein